MTPTRQQLVEMVEGMSHRHPLCQHPYLGRLCDVGNNNLPAIHRFVETLYVVSNTLLSCQLDLTARTDHEDVRAALVADINDEYGAGRLADGRTFAMRKLLCSLGYNEFTPAGIHGETGGVIDRLDRFCRKEPPLKALGCAWLGVRRSRLLLFKNVYTAFRKKPVLQAADLSAFDVRSGELARANDALAVVTPFMDAPEGRRLLYEGVLASTTMFDDLWSSLMTA